MGIENCQIIFDQPRATYFPGDTVNGLVAFNFNSVKKVRGIEVQFKGLASTYWTEEEEYKDDDDKDQKRTIEYYASEQYFNIKYYLLGGKNDDSTEIRPGQHQYPFSYALPTVLPSSFEGSKGHIRYTVTVTLIRPWKFDQSIKAAYTVITHLDVNSNPKWRQPATLTMEKYFCCLFCKSGPLTGIFKVPYTGYVSGQVIPITLEFDNVSNVDIMSTKIKMKKIVTFHARRPTRKTSTFAYTIAEMPTGFRVAKKESKIFNGSITIPSLPPSNLTNCSIIDIRYELRITVIVDGMHKNMKGKLPITIGTIPLINMVPMSPPTVNDSSISNQIAPPVLGWIPAPPDAPPIDPTLMPPPSYEECQFGAKTILEHGESEYTQLNSPTWAPSYPVYRFDIYPSAPNISGSGDSGPSAPSLPKY